MKKRGNPYPNKYKYGKPKRPFSLDVWLKFVARVKQVDRHGFGVEFLEALHAVFFWTGLRRSEVLGRDPLPYKVMHKLCQGRGCDRCVDGKVFKIGPAHEGLMKEDCRLDFDEGERYLLVYSLEEKVLKHGIREEPIWIGEKLPYVDRVINHWKQAEPETKLFNISHMMFWRICKAMDVKFTPHFYRHNKITEMSDDPNTSLAEICSLTGLSPLTVSKYLLRSGRRSRRTGRRLVQKYGAG